MLNQILVNGVIAGAGILVTALGFFLVFRVARFFHFAHGAVFTLGPYLLLALTAYCGLPFLPACLLTAAICSVVGCSMEWMIYRPLRQRGGSPLVLLLASLGVYVALQNIISLAFGDDTKTLRSGTQEEPLNILGARIMPIHMITIAVGVALAIAVALLLRTTKMGRAMRAVADKPTLAQVSGINPQRVILWSFAVGSGIGGMAGILVALDVDMSPTMGLNALIAAVVAVIIGGTKNVAGVVAGALFLGLAQQLGAWKIGAQWQSAVTFLILLAFLLFRPQGFFGREVKKATV